MKEIYSKKSKSKDKKKKNKSELKTYWSILYPEEYSSLLVQFETKPVKVAMKKFAKLSDRKQEKIKGRLMQTEDGFLYIDLPDELLEAFTAMIDDPKAKKPPYHTKKMNNVGAHVSVAYKDEMEDKEVKELGDEFYCGIKGFVSLDPEGWNEMDRVWFLELDAPELEDLRKSYGLSKKLNGHEFHATVCVKYK